MSALSLRELQDFDPRAPIRPEGETRFCCPECGQAKPRDSAHRSLTAQLRTGQYHCHRCQASGILAEHRDREKRESRQDVVRRAFALRRAAPPAQSDAAWTGRLQGLQPINGTPGASYLAGRGISEQYAHHAGVRYHPAWYGRPAVVFGFRDRHAHLVAAQGRCIDGKDPSKLSAGPIGHGVFGAPGALEVEPIVVVEAPIDALSLGMIGVTAMALAGTQGKPWLARHCAFRRVLLALDADAAGDSHASELAVGFQALGARCERLRPAGGKDWNEILQAQGLESLSAALAGIRDAQASRDPVLQRDPEPGEIGSPYCRCGAQVEGYTPSGIPFCAAHAPAVQPGVGSFGSSCCLPA